MTIAEELNISKAAQKLFVSQQCLSAHVKKLEQEYHAILLHRKPKLALTPAGETLVRMLKQMQLLEADIRSELASTAGEEKGYLKIGIHSSRSEQFGTAVFARYWENFPHVTLSITDGSTASFEYMLANGQLDMYIGVNPMPNAKHEQVLLYCENIFVAMTDNLIRQYFPEQYPECVARFQAGVDLREFQHVPFLFTHDDQSLITHALAMFLSQSDIHLNIRAYSNNGLMRNALAAMDYGVSICTELRKATIESHASTRQPLPSPLLFFPIKNFDHTIKIYLIYRKDIYKPKYFWGFVENIRACFSDFSS